MRYLVRLERRKGLWLELGPHRSTASLGATRGNRPTEPTCLSPDCVLWGCRLGAAGTSGFLDWKERHLGWWSSSFICGLWKLVTLVSGSSPLALLLGSLWQRSHTPLCHIQTPKARPRQVPPVATEKKIKFPELGTFFFFFFGLVFLFFPTSFMVRMS